MISIGSIPEMVSLLGFVLEKILSIKVADVGVMRVGLIMVGMSECAKFVLIKSFVGG